MSEPTGNIWGSMIFNTTPPEMPRDVWNILILPESIQGEATQQTEHALAGLKPRIRKLAEQSGISLERYITAILDLAVKKRRARSKKK